MDKIQEICYLPTLRCPLDCKHCVRADIPKSEELDCLAVLEQLKQSVLLDAKVISISGGEPFFSPTFSRFILTGLRQTPYHFSITSNGYFQEEIAAMVEEIAPEDKKRVSITISIDGLRDTHNTIRRNIQSFDRAVQTVKYLVQKKITVSINTVTHESNLHELSKLTQFLKDISPSIIHACTPIAADISEEKSYVYTDQYQTILWPYITEIPFRKKQLLSKGKYLIQNCHAGKKNIVIGPDGKVHTCLTGAYHQGREQSKEFLLGDLKQNTLDEILLNEDKRKSVYVHAVKSCAGCSNPYELSREVNLFNLQIIGPQEIPDAFRLEKQHVIGSGLLDYAGWHVVEEAADGSRWCWSNSTVAKVFVPIEAGKIAINGNGGLISLTYSKIVPDLKVKVFLNGAEVFSGNDTQWEETIQLPIPELYHEPYLVLTFVTDKMYRPSELSGGPDSRELGVCLREISLEP